MNKLAAHWRGQAGFTLIEMVTVIMVISVLTALILVNTQVGNRRQELRDTAAEFVNRARNAEARASAAEPVDGTSRKAYGICLTSKNSADAAGTFPKSECAPPQGVADAYQVYARTVADTDANPLNQRPENPDILSSHELPKDVRFFFGGNLYLDYVPPQPLLFVRGSTNDQAVYLFSPKTKGYTKRIWIKPKSGAVYVE